MSDERPSSKPPDPTPRAADLSDAIAETEDRHAEILEESAADLGGNDDQEQRARDAREAAKNQRERADQLRENPLPESAG